jgi:hypothetical protein
VSETRLCWNFAHRLLAEFKDSAYRDPDGLNTRALLCALHAYGVDALGVFHKSELAIATIDRHLKS